MVEESKIHLTYRLPGMDLSYKAEISPDVSRRLYETLEANFGDFKILSGNHHTAFHLNNGIFGEDVVIYFEGNASRDVIISSGRDGLIRVMEDLELPKWREV